MPPAKKALCVGINYAGTGAELRGPVNDALRWVDILTHGCGFQRSAVLAMIDEYPSGEAVADDDESYMRPTKENILEALEWFVEEVSEGDVLLFVFAGHGVQVPEAAMLGGGEPLEEALCPLDWEEFEWGVVPYRLIGLDVLHRYFAKLPGGVLLTVVLDACIAGAPVRVPFRVDYRHPDREIEDEQVTQDEYRTYIFDCDVWLQSQHVNALPRRPPAEPERPLWSRFARLFVKDEAPPLNEGLAVFCIAACRGAQTALDASLEGIAQGCLSYCLLQALELLGNRCSYAELCAAADRVALQLRSEVMPSMDQFFQLTYGKNAGPSECYVFDPASAFVAKDRARRRRGQRHRPA